MRPADLSPIVHPRSLILTTAHRIGRNSDQSFWCLEIVAIPSKLLKEKKTARNENTTVAFDNVIEGKIHMKDILKELALL